MFSLKNNEQQWNMTDESDEKPSDSMAYFMVISMGFYEHFHPRTGGRDQELRALRLENLSDPLAALLGDASGPSGPSSAEVGATGWGTVEGAENHAIPQLWR